MVESGLFLQMLHFCFSFLFISAAEDSEKTRGASYDCGHIGGKDVLLHHLQTVDAKIRGKIF